MTEKKKVTVTTEEMRKIQRIKRLARLATHPLEVKMYREQMNAIIEKAAMRG